MAEKKHPTHRDTWKKFESRVAAFFESKRMPFSGAMENLPKGDVIHDFLYIECKLKADLFIFDRYNELKNDSNLPLVFNITDRKRYEETLWLFHCDYFNRIVYNANELSDENGVPRLIVLKYRVNLVNQNAKALARLFGETALKAKGSGRIPVVAVTKKNLHGWLMVINPEHICKISKFTRDGKAASKIN